MEIEADAPCKRSYRVFLEVFIWRLKPMLHVSAPTVCVFLEVIIWRLKPMLHVSAPTVCVS